MNLYVLLLPLLVLGLILAVLILRPARPVTGRWKRTVWLPVLLVVATVLAVLWLWKSEHMMAEFAGEIAPCLAAVLVVLWAIFFTGLARKWKWIFFGWFAFVLAGLAALFRFEGSSTGGMGLKFTPRWIAPLEELQWEEASDASSAVAAALTAPEGAANFPGYLGESSEGRVHGILDPDWAEHPPEEIWRQPIGLGWGAFSVLGGRAVTLEQRQDQELVSCYSLADGELLWTHAETARFSEPAGGDGPRSTPTLADGKVYALGATGLLHCLDLETGKPIWKRDVLEDSGAAKNLEWATTSSPLLREGRLFVFGGEENTTGRLLCYDPASGDLLWAKGSGTASYASPSYTTIDGVPQILCTNAGSLSGHDFTTGEQLWELPWGGAMPIKASQIRKLQVEELYCSAGYNLGSIRFAVHRNVNGEWEAEERWSSRRMKTKFSNVSIKGMYAWGLDEGRFSCQDLETGERLWKEANYGYGQQLLVGNHILVQTERGHLALVEANPNEFVELARLETALSSKTWNPPCLAGEYLLVRNDREAICYRLKLQE